MAPSPHSLAAPLQRAMGVRGVVGIGRLVVRRTAAQVAHRDLAAPTMSCEITAPRYLPFAPGNYVRVFADETSVCILARFAGVFDKEPRWEVYGPRGPFLADEHWIDLAYGPADQADMDWLLGTGEP